MNKQNVRTVSLALPDHQELNVEAVATYRMSTEIVTTIRSKFISQWLSEGDYPEGKLFSAKLHIVSTSEHRYYDVVSL